ncbi:MAG: tetratricopeptide repeat protein, partial [Proteobacteria bacterium]|nr:tetratricopeptide repeat protein [Pseudomonadota bacterium]
MMGKDPTKLEEALGCLQENRVADAAALVEEVLRADPESPGAHHLAGLVDLGRGRAESALGHFEKAVAGAPDNVDFRLNMGVALDNLGRGDEATV